MQDEIIDLNIGGTRCIVNRLSEQRGENMVFFGKHGTVKYESIVVSPLK
jgi:beta-fructofuranosidase